METTLFWIGCGLGGSAFVLRQIFKREEWSNRGTLIAALHLLLVMAGWAMIGFVISASVDLHGPTPKWPLLGAIGGFLYALPGTRQARKSAEGSSEVLAEDLEWVETSFSAILLAAVIMYAVLQAFKIPSGSMEDTLHVGDHLFVNKFIYGVRIPYTNKRVARWRSVQRHDIVVFQCPPSALSQSDREANVRKDFIKRAIGLPGDEILIKDKKLYVNGQPQEESYAIYRDPIKYPAEPMIARRPEYQSLWESGELAAAKNIRDNFGPIKVPPESYFVMGDNRDGSFDSRFWGPLPDRLLKGKAWFVYWPPAWFYRFKLWLVDAAPPWIRWLRVLPFMDVQRVRGPMGVRIIR